MAPSTKLRAAFAIAYEGDDRFFHELVRLRALLEALVEACAQLEKATRGQMN
jgi:hypothetical protein